jgi:hypothetical protein
MRYIYFDESLHDRGGFALGAFVMSNGDPTQAVESAIRGVGLNPGRDEYKSRMSHASDSRYVNLRDEIYGIVRDCDIGLMIAPASDRSSLGEVALRALAYLIRENTIKGPITAFFDQGLFTSKEHGRRLAALVTVPADVDLRVECDSRQTLGIQLADLVAHTAAVMLLGHMGIVTKTVKAGANSGYDENDEFPLEFELWARLRWNLMSRAITDPELANAANSGLVDTTCALYVAPSCPPELVDMAHSRFAHTWRGCIH